jgi:hypothetical protein
MHGLSKADFHNCGRISDSKSAELFTHGKKWCARCRRVRGLSAFSRNRAVKGGYSGHCRQCRKSIKAERVARIADQPDSTALERFTAKIHKTKQGCWIWRSALDESGHGIFVMRGKTMLAHRAAVEVFGKAIPPGKVSWLTCRVPPCANPDHVMFCTRRELSTEHAKDNPFARNARKDHCAPHGHPYSPDNTHWFFVLGGRGGVRRDCIACHKLRRPNTKVQPNTREDALSDRTAQLTKLAFEETRALNPQIREDVRNELVAVLWGRKGVPRGNWVKRLVKKLSAAEWSRLPGRFGLSADAPLSEDGGTLLDVTADASIFADPGVFAEVAELDEAEDVG